MAPEISDHSALSFLSTQGWLPLSLSTLPSLLPRYQNLLTASRTYFALPDTSPQKTRHRSSPGPQATESGFSLIEGEKSLFTLRTSSACPETLSESAKGAWEASGAFLAEILQAIAETLELDHSVFGPFADPCVKLPTQKRTPTLLRIFRYERPRAGCESKVNAEAHKDLGLLSLVVGESPGLQCLDVSTKNWVGVEEARNLPAGAREEGGGLTLTLLVGETLEWLSNGTYKAGTHRVLCAPAISNTSSSDGDDAAEERWRYSMVYTLRPANAPVFTKSFESSITGLFDQKLRVDGESMDVFFARIRNSHYNINAALDVRDEQKKKQKEQRKLLEGSGGKVHPSTHNLAING